MKSCTCFIGHKMLLTAPKTDAKVYLKIVLRCRRVASFDTGNDLGEPRHFFEIHHSRLTEEGNRTGIVGILGESHNPYHIEPNLPHLPLISPESSAFITLKAFFMLHALSAMIKSILSLVLHSSHISSNAAIFSSV